MSFALLDSADAKSLSRLPTTLALPASDVDRLTTAAGHNNYTACTGSYPNMNNGITPGLFGGMYGAGPYVPTTVGLQDIVDGTSQTVAFSERVKAIGSNFGATTARRL